MEKIIGRNEEQKVLEQLLKSEKPEFLAVYGRRRVGKTFLIRQVYNKQIAFQMTGIARANTSQQLANFFSVLRELDTGIGPGELPKNWFDAFSLLRNYLKTLKAPKKVVFFDELPWIDTPRSNFLSALEHFWNAWASNRPDILLVVCGSAASWMINKLINNKGGLYNRVTQRIRLLPFTLQETESFFRAHQTQLDRYQILQLYMAMGGVPFYLNAIRQGKSAFQEIDRLAFSKNGLLALEYDNLYGSLFNQADRHIMIIEVLAGKPKGLGREEMVKLSGIKDGGALTTILRELEESGFISKSVPFGKKIRDSIYRLSDPYTLFYLKFIKDQKLSGAGAWLSRIDSPAWRAWSGYAYESICLQHVTAIKKALGISGVYTEESSWVDKERSVQIDLLIDRRDHVINLCEVKFTQEPFTLTKVYKKELERKLFTFKEETQTRKSVFPVLITTWGLKENLHSLGFIQSTITMDDLFDPS
ncbi:AAA family ATPase [Pseudoflavitalea sp. X16]|uniref:AAA family ATPase n=1 Tax=Paraflavitalea devenefica TaxID=2716334 RepID=UPI00142340C1|nr:ATP-binding protein [Paraflavitalea devenefica]NII28542.1 AAA family ATPase [Paraflavitalea devenefica]